MTSWWYFRKELLESVKIWNIETKSSKVDWRVVERGCVLAVLSAAITAMWHSCNVRKCVEVTIPSQTHKPHVAAGLTEISSTHTRETATITKTLLPLDTSWPSETCPFGFFANRWALKWGKRNQRNRPHLVSINIIPWTHWRYRGLQQATNCICGCSTKKHLRFVCLRSTSGQPHKSSYVFTQDFPYCLATLYLKENSQELLK